MVKPQIDSLNESPRNVTVVVVQKNDAILHSGFAAKPINLLDQRFAAFILRMRFAREDELNRPSAIVKQTLQTSPIAKEQRSTLVGGETSGKSDRQNVRIQEPVSAANHLW